LGYLSNDRLRQAFAAYGQTVLFTFHQDRRSTPKVLKSSKASYGILPYTRVGVLSVEASKLMELGDALRHGLLADRVVDILSHEVKLAPQDRRVLESVKTFVDHAQSGSEQLNTGRLTENAIESITAYRATIQSMRLQPKGDAIDEIDGFLNDMRKEVELMLKKGRTAPNEAEKTRHFFRAVRKSVIYTVGRSLGREDEALAWPPPTAP